MGYMGVLFLYTRSHFLFTYGGLDGLGLGFKVLCGVNGSKWETERSSINSVHFTHHKEGSVRSNIQVSWLFHSFL